MLKRLPALSALIVLLAAGSACAVHNPDAPNVAGPSELGISFAVKVTPDTLPEDGGSQASIVVTAKDPNAKPISGLTLHLDIEAGGVAQDFGSLSARTIVTGSDGTASAVYTAPPPLPPAAAGAGLPPCKSFAGTANDSCVTIAASTVNNNHVADLTQRAEIRLTQPGEVLPPAGAPTARFTINPTPPVLQGSLVLFDATASTPGNGATQIVSYSWDFGDGATGTGPKTSHSYAGFGTFNVTLVVTNDRGFPSAPAVQAVQVKQAGAPKATFVFSPTAPVVGQQVVFDGSGSQADVGHQITQFNWAFGDGASGSGFTTTHAYTTPGTYNVTLNILDDTGQKATFSASVTVGTGNPTAVLTLTKAGVLTINADGTASTAAPGFIIQTYTFVWDDGSPNTVTSSPAVTHTFPAGPHTVVLRVTDNASPPRTGSASASITVP